MTVIADTCATIDGDFRCGPFRIRPMRFTHAGCVVATHAHNFDHVTYVVKGELLIEKLDESDAVLRAVLKKAGEWVLVKAGVRHRVTAMADDSEGRCMFVHRDHRGELTEVDEGWEPSYV